MKKTQIILATFISIFMLGTSVKETWANDLFPQLENITIGQKVPAEIKSLGKEIVDDKPNTLFLEFESSSKTYPHFLEMNQNDEVIYVEIKIPETHLEIYHAILRDLGTPETKEQKSPTYVLFAYPSKGLGFIVSERNSNFLIQTKYPVKTVEQLKNNEAKNFKEISQKDTFPTGIITPKPTEPVIPKDLQLQQKTTATNKKNTLGLALSSFGIFILIWAAFKLKRYLKNKKQKQQEKQSFINFSDKISLPNKKDQV